MPCPKAMISQPLAGKTEQEITDARNTAIAYLESAGYKVINTLFTEEWGNREKLVTSGIEQIPVHFLSKSLAHMAQCHTVYFAKGWEAARGCVIEHDVAISYGLGITYEENIQ